MKSVRSYSGSGLAVASRRWIVTQAASALPGMPISTTGMAEGPVSNRVNREASNLLIFNDDTGIDPISTDADARAGCSRHHANLCRELN